LVWSFPECWGTAACDPVPIQPEQISILWTRQFFPRKYWERSKELKKSDGIWNRKALLERSKEAKLKAKQMIKWIGSIGCIAMDSVYLL
jgi:hypothetical protein